MSKKTVNYTRRHMALNIEGALRNFGRPGKKGYKNMKGLMSDDSGNEISDEQIRIYLHNCQTKGWEVIPCCPDSECPDFDHFGGGCPGHPISKEEYEKEI